MAVGVKVAGGAVRRNEIRRAIRECFRLHQHDLPAADIFVSARGASRAAANAEIAASLERLWGQIRIS
jgi:ribonuclease P protein component